MAEHSKTPWRAEGPDDFGDYNILNGDDCLAIAAVVSNMRPAECVAANAAFIVRSANCHAKLVEALQMFIAWDDDTHDTSPAAQHGLAMKKARAAVAEAKGQTP